ncbi:hypothetical protein MOB18_21450 [Bacillus inaquosorum]|uniref:hypothetical protein n=1 Tax=Bacillus inaquosorum TaxID=483913 RepID=UPI00228245DD|nr:hypothetical protein [Bacillus inaquosorum]MCY7751630.1 hypothetical protein [Bacillus inaquosorum]MCY9063273.1 hypothetical protein [Bacillus inaquosorum]
MKAKFAVFSDYGPDAGQSVFDTYEEALADYNERINDDSESGVDAYLCVVIDEYKAK